VTATTLSSAAPRSGGTTYFSRRQVLQATAAAAAASSLAGSQAPAAEEAPTATRHGHDIDAHVHVWTKDTKRYKLASPYTVKDMVPPDFTPDELLSIARPHGVDRITLIQMHFYGFDNAYMLDSIARFPGVFRGVAVIDEHAPDACERMRTLVAKGVRGFRLYPFDKPVEPWLDSAGMKAMWKCGAETGQAMCALINPEGLPALDAMCARFPQTPVVVDHFGRIGMQGPVRKEDIDNLCRLARHKRTHVKVSAYYALGQKKAPYLDLAPMFRRLIEAFGPERLMWASDCPFQVQDGHTYRDSIELVRSRLDFLSDSDRQWLLRRTAEKVFFS